jgi:hypothetical protein
VFVPGRRGGCGDCDVAGQHIAATKQFARPSQRLNDFGSRIGAQLAAHVARQMRYGWQEPARKPAPVGVSDGDPANVQLSRERDEERSPHRFDVDHILKRHRTEQLGGEADAVKRRVAQLVRQHRALG